MYFGSVVTNLTKDSNFFMCNLIERVLYCVLYMQSSIFVKLYQNKYDRKVRISSLKAIVVENYLYELSEKTFLFSFFQE